MMGKAPHVSHAELLAMLRYDPLTGVFTWLTRADRRQHWNSRYAGKRAGYVWTLPDGTQYRVIRINDWPFSEHRLAVFYVTGEWPPDDVDHADLDGLNNRYVNLRPATKAQNGANRGASRVSKSGLKGVTFDKRAGRWRATIHAGGRQHWLGHFDTPEQASEAYAAAAKRLHGEFARAA